MNILDYLFLRDSAMGNDFVTHAATDEKSGGGNENGGGITGHRMVISIFGILLGIFLSFVVTGLEKIEGDKSQPTTESTTQSTETANDDTASTGNNSTDNEDDGGITVKWPSKDKLFVMLLVTLVICFLSYQGLYISLKMYKNEPGFLILCFSFQYGFFWQSVIKGTAVVL